MVRWFVGCVFIVRIGVFVVLVGVVGLLWSSYICGFFCFGFGGRCVYFLSIRSRSFFFVFRRIFCRRCWLGWGRWFSMVVFGGLGGLKF